MIVRRPSAERGRANHGWLDSRHTFADVGWQGRPHSEMNPSSDTPVHFFQIWLLPAQRGIAPAYEQKRFEDSEKQGRLRLVASSDGRDGSITVNQDADLYAGLFKPGEGAHLALRPGRHAWVQVARGDVTLNGETLEAGDGAAVSDEAALELHARSDAEVLVFDLA